MSANQKKEYFREYVKARQVRCYPPPKQLAFVRGLQEQKGMGESETIIYLIQVAQAALEPKPVSKNSF